MYFYIRGSSIVASVDPPQDEELVQLSDAEKIAALIIYEALEASGVDVSTIHYERTEEYLKVVADRFFCFCRLKLSGRSLYIELTISSKDAKKLSGDPRFSGVPASQKRFTRFPLRRVEDVSLYCDVVYLAYSWGTTTA